ncbi:MAG: hypothetical protein ACD_46C00114G0003 [uncultured bacterium]|nr:MAG: hypothetical protein ACD_46C00114G0003 [uncultured bacterium]
MSLKKLVWLIGLCALITGCATNRQESSYEKNYASTDSATDMGMRYLLGRGVPKNNEKAFSYLSEAADNDPFAQNEIAYLYATGKGTKQDYAKAFKYYQKAANHDLASAQYNLGLFYLYGLGTEPNKTLARKWFQKSAAHGFEPAKQALAQY